MKKKRGKRCLDQARRTGVGVRLCAPLNLLFVNNSICSRPPIVLDQGKLDILGELYLACFTP